MMFSRSYSPKPLLSLGLAIAGTCALVLFGCSAAGGSGGEASLEGTWLVTHPEPIVYDPDADNPLTDAQIFVFSGSEVELVFYYDTEQVMGQRGVYTVSADTLVMTFDEWWNPGSLDWTTDDDGATLAFSLNGGTLSITPPGETEGVALTKTSFSVRPELVGTWYGEESIAGSEMGLAGTGEFAYFSGDVIAQSGSWSATGSYIRSVDDSVGSMGYLNPYQLQDGGARLVIDVDGGTTQTYVDTPPLIVE
jgi:hypothetical protein